MKKLIITALILAILLPTDANALFFNGSARVTGAIDLSKEPVSQVTFMAWVYSTSTSATAAIGGRATSTSVAGPYFLRIQSGLGLRWGIRTTGADQSLNSTSGTWRPGRWNHAAGVYDGTNMIIYINGVLATTTLKTNPGNLMGAGVDTYPITIGQYIGTTATACGGCDIADVRVYNRALSATEIRDYYYTGYASRNGLAHHFPLWSLPAVNFANYTRMGSTTGSGITQRRLPNFAKYKK